ncbi:signal transduction histidine kinase [Flavobacterium croceum DSM 17960]|uniref:histidine kinase n=1 Tax=Flavobacterium croceum DSM 17960 TaxID=1121886 RepID=A0A2S4N709_9FLAO|nr:HAMP domain-containing sensor histidine kinase [Flavobacterium croceum]POS01133.1 signal transduction histidine kinase [Flavobacterium croceum DSM 17960]
MNSFSFKNRIAFYYIISTAMLVLIVFITIHVVAKKSVYVHLDADIHTEINKLFGYINVQDNAIVLTNAQEWKEEEHSTEEVNPIFVELLDLQGNLFDKSPNLKKSRLHFSNHDNEKEIFNAKLNGKSVRQIKVPIFDKDKKVGFIQVAILLESSSYVLQLLNTILVVSFPIILLLLFLIARFFAGRSISPIYNVIETSNLISTDNLSSRIALPNTKDEIYVLSQTINNLLDRIERAVEREKQFTSDASHELRTPLAVIQGTLEVLIRKPRTEQEYNQKIAYCISEVNRINTIVDQLLLLARLENQKQSISNAEVSITNIIHETINRYSAEIANKNIKVLTTFTENFWVHSDAYFLSIIINNLFSNAVKYCYDAATINLFVLKENEQIKFVIQDEGIGISQPEIEKIFNPFFRAKNTLDNSKEKGIGLGLSIVKRLCDILSIQVEVESKDNVGTKFTLYFP